jgi:peroxiredoxin
VDLPALSDTTLADHTGTTHRLGDLWSGKPVVLVFLRHFG